MQKNLINDEENEDRRERKRLMLSDKLGVFLVVAVNTALYAGLDKSEFNRIAPLATAENRMSLIHYSMTSAIFFAVLALLGAAFGGFTGVNIPIYAGGCVMMLLMFFISSRIRPERTQIIRLLTYVFMMIIYTLSIILTLLHANMLAVMFIAMLLAMPLLFYDRPVIMSGITIFVTAVFCVLVNIFKAPDLAEADMCNVMTFAALAIVIEMTVGRLRYRTLSQKEQIRFMSYYDLLTGLKNRNSYEVELESYPQKCSGSLICIYADANGLHELNKEKGHKAGDLMLKYIAAHMQSAFGSDTYRLGGDEFMALMSDESAEKVRADIERLEDIFDRRGYAVSFGFAEAVLPGIKMDQLTTEAEHEMYMAKERYYKETGTEPR